MLMYFIDPGRASPSRSKSPVPQDTSTAPVSDNPLDAPPAPKAGDAETGEQDEEMADIADEPKQEEGTPEDQVAESQVALQQNGEAAPEQQSNAALQAKQETC